MIVAKEFWETDIALHLNYREEGPGCWVTIIRPKSLAGAVAQPAPASWGFCDAVYPESDHGCCLVAGHDGPHWLTTWSLLMQMDQPVQIIRGEQYPDVWLLTGGHPLFGPCA